MNFDLNNDLSSTSTKKALKDIIIPTYILNGINEKKFILRDYQEEALKRFIYYTENKDIIQENIENNDLFLRNKNHLLFNMATGTGKTLLMACIIIYLYKEYNYNNFIFLSHLNSINIKTKDNFFNKNSEKYLFNKNIDINECNSFNFVDNNIINIIINTYQGISSLLRENKENAFNLKDIKDKKIVIIADEGHHLNAGTDSNSGEWEKSVNDILNNNDKNFLLEFTATINWKEDLLNKKYKSKCIYKYELKKFYEEKWTKTISLLQRDTNYENLMLGTVILSEYRQALFNELGEKIKPIILFKSDKISNSEKNNNIFIDLINNLSDKIINDFEKDLEDGLIKTALNYLKNKYGLSLSTILKNDFSEKNIINTNKENEIENNAILLNTLENKDNKKRVIFTVDKLNEGWDVLNLFDIVKLYETNTKKTTTQEAQLIGRGARYCNFYYKNEKNYKRIFDNDENYGILEKLYFHSKQDSATINDLKKELKNIGILETKEKVKISIKNECFEEIKSIDVLYNEKVKKNNIENKEIYDKIHKFINSINLTMDSNNEIDINIMNEENINNINNNKIDIINLKNDFEPYIKINAFVNNTNYNFNELKKEIGIKSIKDFIEKIECDNNNNNVEIKIKNWKNSTKNQYKVYEKIIQGIYEKILYKEIKKFEGTKEFSKKKFNEIFKKDIFLERSELKIDETIGKNKFYIYDKAILTSQEICFFNLFKNELHKKLENNGFSKIFLVRNEKELKFYKFKDGNGFEPDFILFMEKNNFIYQILIEPKGDHLITNDDSKAKEEFLEEITKITENNKLKLKGFENNYYKLIGICLYNKEKERSEFIPDFNKKVLN